MRLVWIALAACGSSQTSAPPSPSPSASPVVETPSPSPVVEEATPSPSPSPVVAEHAQSPSPSPKSKSAEGKHVATIPVVDVKPDYGPYPKAVLKRIIRNAVNDLGDCYRKHSTDDMSRHVDVDFTIGSDGKVVDAMSKPSGNDELDKCLAAEFKKLVFPPPQGGGQIKVTYPVGFIFAGQ